MTVDHSAISDTVAVAAGYSRPVEDRGFIRGHGVAVLRDADGNVKQTVDFVNLVTEVGDQYYGDAGAGLHANATVADPNAVTGMRLGTGTTAVAKTGAGAAIVTYVTGSSIAIAATFPTSTLNVGARRITWQTVWAAGVATSDGIAEVVITNEATLTNVAGTAANTISRALLSPVVNKASGDSLTVTWHHELLGS